MGEVCKSMIEKLDEKTKKRIMGAYKALLLVAAFLLFFVINLFYPGLVAVSFFVLLYRFNLLSSKIAVLGIIVCTVVGALITTIFRMIDNFSNKNYKIVNRIKMNTSRYSIVFLLFVIGVFSLEKEVIWTYDKLKEVLSLEWTIYGISMTIFLVWNVLIVEYLKGRKPEVPQDPFPTYTRKYINEKGNFYELASSVFSSVSLLKANTFFLIGTSCSSIIAPAEMTLINQNLVIFTFFLCTNTLVSLFLDVLRPLHEEREKLLKGTKVTDDEVDLLNRIDLQVSKTLDLLDAVDKMENLNEEQREVLRKGIIENFQKLNDTELSLKAHMDGN